MKRISFLISIYFCIFVNASTHISSWNMRFMGRDSLDLERVAKIIKETDLMAIQEVLGPDKSITKFNELIQILEETGNEYCFVISDEPTGDWRRYAFVWNLSKVKLIQNEEIQESCPHEVVQNIVYQELADEMIREPAVLDFYLEDEEAPIVLVNSHLVPYSKNPSEEVARLFEHFRNWSGPIAILGDFNLSSKSSDFNIAREAGFVESFDGIKTSLKRKKRQFNKAYDNIWLRELSYGAAYVFNPFKLFPELTSWEIYQTLSDHAPIQIEFAN